MNWLAHLHLSEPTPEFRLGNLLPDMVSRQDLTLLPEVFQAGIDRHLQIDAFTDSHPIFRRSVQRLKAPYRRYGAIVIDIFYDHFLACHWKTFAPVPLPQFISEVYAGFEKYASLVPPSARLRLERMQAEDWLGSYREVVGIATALGRLGQRLRQPVDLAGVAGLLETDRAPFDEDFRRFYPELQAQVQLARQRLPPKP